MKFSEKKIYFFILGAFFLHGFFASNAQDGLQTLKDDVDKVVDKAKEKWDGAGGMLKSLGQSIGLVSKDYYYNYRVFNDSYSSLFVAEQRLTSFLGATFEGRIVQAALLGPMSNQEFFQSQLYITLYFCPGELSSQINYKTPHDAITNWGERMGKKVLIVPGAEPIGKIAKAFGYDTIDNFDSWLEGAVGKTLGSAVGSIVGAFSKGSFFTYKNQLDNSSVLTKTIYPWQPNDNNVYYYRVYTDVADQKPVMKGEALSLMGTSSEFSGQFYNSSSQDILMSFSKDGIDYVVTLEAGSFSMLESSTKENSIRPLAGTMRWFQCYNKKPLSDENAIVAIPIAPEGIAYMSNASKENEKPQYVVDGAALYSYKIYASSVQKSGLDLAVQGISIGNFDQPVSGKVRDINPVQCHLWYTSASQAKALAEKKQTGSPTPDYSSQPFDIPEQVWITYKTNDYTYQQKIAVGSVTDFTLLRPQLKEKIASLYVVSLQTDDDKKAQQFLDRLNTGVIGQTIFHTQATINENNVLTALTPNVNGIIADTQGSGNSGIQGTILLADQFMPQGLGDGPYYYVLDPGDLRVDQFAGVIWFDDSLYSNSGGNSVLKPEVMKDLSEKLPQWIVQYRTDSQAATAALKSYLGQKANTGLSAMQADALLKTLVSGPVSLEHYPILKKSGTNYYVMGFGSKPDDWPL